MYCTKSALISSGYNDYFFAKYLVFRIKKNELKRLVSVIVWPRHTDYLKLFTFVPRRKVCCRSVFELEKG